MINIAICDDNIIDVNYIESLVIKWGKNNNINYHIDKFTSAENYIYSKLESVNYDILLLDIEMGNMDGVTLAKEIRKNDKLIQIIFITGYSDYILDGYDVAALHYLMKPINEEKLNQVLIRALEKLTLNEKVINLTIGGEMMRIPLHEIVYLEVFKNYVTIYGKQEYKIKKTLGECEKLLDDRFFRIGRSAIVNLNYISRVTKTQVIMSNGVCILLPRGMYDSLNRAIISHT